MGAAKGLDSVEDKFGGKSLECYGQLREVIEKELRQLFGDALPLFSSEQCVQYLVRPERRGHGSVALRKPPRNMLSQGGVFVGEAPAQNDGGVEDKPAHRRPSLIRSLILSPLKDNL
jgi:hypothetical protein